MAKEKRQVEQNVINVNVSAPPKGDSKGITKYLNSVKEAFSFITEASNKSLAKFFIIVATALLLIIGGKVLYNASESEEVMNAISNWIEGKNANVEEKGMEIRQDITTPAIQKEIRLLCYTLNADRVFLFELHNGKKSAGGLPFIYADMSYEEVNIEKCLEFVGTEFQNIPLTLYKYPHYIYHKRYEYATLEEISEIDMAFAKHIENIGGKYLATIYITVHSRPLAFLCASFHSSPVLTEDVIKGKMENSARVLKPLLDLETQLNKPEKL